MSFVRSLVLGAMPVLVATTLASTEARAETPEPARQPSSSFAMTIVPEFGVSAFATTTTMPATLTLARAIGSSSSSIYAAGIPALLFAVFVPPAISTATVTWYRNRLRPGTARFFPTYWYGVGAQLAVVAGAVGAKAWVGDAKDLLILSAIDGLVLPAAVTLGTEIHAKRDEAEDGARHARTSEIPVNRLHPIQTVPLVRGTF